MTEVNKQTEANKRWQENNRERAKFLRNRSTSRSFIRKQAMSEDLDELQGLIDERRTNLASGELDD
ncbi:hypothetical protein D3P96_06210 [Weissella viridescens]|uniref:Uncharacterized protein n=1 Tax=Weissella viridescens TaxID=1629 RepID=A0A3P2RD94_WEIVI|nr:hypothetical protein [Weissella viridescens]RRG17746.1 hypothetical protein D3P96_06210 [Weissella viridescens]